MQVDQKYKFPCRSKCVWLGLRFFFPFVDFSLCLCGFTPALWRWSLGGLVSLNWLMTCLFVLAPWRARGLYTVYSALNICERLKNFCDAFHHFISLNILQHSVYVGSVGLGIDAPNVGLEDTLLHLVYIAVNNVSSYIESLHKAVQTWFEAVWS